MPINDLPPIGAVPLREVPGRFYAGPSVDTWRVASSRVELIDDPTQTFVLRPAGFPICFPDLEADEEYRAGKCTLLDAARRDLARKEQTLLDDLSSQFADGILEAWGQDGTTSGSWVPILGDEWRDGLKLLDIEGTTGSNGAVRFYALMARPVLLESNLHGGVSLDRAARFLCPLAWDWLSARERFLDRFDTNDSAFTGAGDEVNITRFRPVVDSDEAIKNVLKAGEIRDRKERTEKASTEVWEALEAAIDRGAILQVLNAKNPTAKWIRYSPDQLVAKRLRGIMFSLGRSEDRTGNKLRLFFKGKAREKSTSAVETQCRRFLDAEYAAGRIAHGDRDGLMKVAREKFPGLGVRGFERAWKQFTEGYPQLRIPGQPRKR